MTNFLPFKSFSAMQIYELHIFFHDSKNCCIINQWSARKYVNKWEHFHLYGALYMDTRLIFIPSNNNFMPSPYNNYYYYSFKIFSRFWLAKSTRLIHHNQLLMTKFGRNLTLTRKWRQKCSIFAGSGTVNREDLGTRLSCFGRGNKNGGRFTGFKSKNKANK